MKKGIFVCCSDRRTSFSFEKQLNEELGLKVKEIINDLGMVEDDYEVVIYIDIGDIPSDYNLKGANILLLTEGMDFSRWERFNSRGFTVLKLDSNLIYLKEELSKLGYGFETSRIQEDVELKPYIAGEKLESNDGIIGIYSVKDGVGKSTIALNLAGYYKEMSPETRVILLDLDSQFSTIKNFTTKNVGLSKINLGKSVFKSDREVYKSNKTGLFISPSSNGIEKPEDIVDMLKKLKKHFDLIIIDIASEIKDSTLTALNCVAALFIVSDNRTYIKEGTVYFAKEGIANLGIRIPEPYIVMNKSSQIKASSFEDRYKLKVVGYIEPDNEIYEYEERKLIYSLGNKKSSMNNCMQDMIKILGINTEQKTKKKFQDIFK